MFGSPNMHCTMVGPISLPTLRLAYGRTASQRQTTMRAGAGRALAVVCAQRSQPARRSVRRSVATLEQLGAQPVGEAECAAAAAGAQNNPKEEANELMLQQAALRKEQRQRQQATYQMSAIAATCGFTTLAVLAVYTRFVWHQAGSSDVPALDIAATILLVFGGTVGMEYYARWAHRVLWHDFAPGWALHESHHKPRVGPFEANDVFALINAVPAMGLCAYGFLRPDVWGGICFGAGLGITLFGIAYMFVHDGLVHKRFPVGPIAQVPYLRRVAVAHKLHHSEKFGGLPWGMFLGPAELEAVGAGEELDKLVKDLEL